MAIGCLDPSSLVPATVIDDPSLPSADIVVNGVSRRIHLREFGDPDAPTILVMPGAACDVVPYLVLSELADAWHVVLWDPRGNGLSERVPAEELAWVDVPLEIEAVRQLVAGDRPVVVVGHSWSAAMLVTWFARFREHAAGLVLIEPPALRQEDQETYAIDVGVFSDPYLDLTWSTWSVGPVDHDWMDFKMTGILQPGVPTFHCDPDDPPFWPIARPGALASLVWEDTVVAGHRFDYPFTEGLGQADVPVLLLGSECSVIGADYQEEVNLPLFPRGEVARVDGVGHRMMVERPEAFVGAVRSWLDRAVR